MTWENEIKELADEFGAEEVQGAIEEILFRDGLKKEHDILEMDEVLKKMIQDNVDEFEI